MDTKNYLSMKVVPTPEGLPLKCKQIHLTHFQMLLLEFFFILEFIYAFG